MNKKYKYIFLLILISCIAVGFARAESEKEIFDRARLALFDGKWDEALNELNRLTSMYPNTSYYSQVLFYKGKCWGMKEVPMKALENYTRFLRVSTNDSLKEEAACAVIDLDFTLYQQQKGNKKYLDEIVGFLSSRQMVVRYYAAIKLSHVTDKAVAAKAVTILKSIISDEQNEELVDRAKIALMRINPDLLKSASRAKALESQMVMIRVYDKKLKKETFSINIPFVLARLALDSLPEHEKTGLRKEGYDLDKLMDKLTKVGEIIRVESEDSVFKIWIE